MQNEMTNKCQFLIGNVRHASDASERKNRDKRCQFLIGNVRQKMKYVIDRNEMKCQFLIGNVRQKSRGTG